jgi:hydrogenase-4 component E
LSLQNKFIMINIFAVVFTMTLFYIGSGSRLDTYIRVLAVQGLLLFGIALIELHELDWMNLSFILVETLLFKAIIVPYFFHDLIKKNHMKNERDPDNPNFYGLFKVSLIIILTFMLAYVMHDQHLKITYFTASVSAIFVGLVMIVRRKKIISQIIGYMLVENGIFLLSLSLGSELPMLVNIGILLDLFTSVLLFGMFVSKIGQIHKTEEIDQLSELRD